MLSRALMALTDWLDRRFGWDRLPRPLGLLTLIGVRDRLRQRNLCDTGLPAASPELIELSLACVVGTPQTQKPIARGILDEAATRLEKPGLG